MGQRSASWKLDCVGYKQLQKNWKQLKQINQSVLKINDDKIDVNKIY